MSDDAIIIGKTILVGLTFCEADGSTIEQQQFFGTIIAFDDESGLAIRLSSGEMKFLPPDLSAIQPAEEAHYCLKSTGEMVINPDYLCTYTITKPTH